MCNFTLRKFNSFKLIFFILLLLISYNASAQFYTKHYIAPAPWQYFSKANEIVIATNSSTTISVTIAKSDGTVITTVSASKGSPAVYRFTPLPKDAPAYAFDTVLNAAGLIVTGTAPISINLRNIASDALGGEGSDKDIKGNAALTSFGDAGIGIRFRIGYYRDGSLGSFSTYGDQRPIYSIMATVDNTTVKINNTVTTTLKAGQSYLFKAPIGSLVESSNPSVMNTCAAIDVPGGCGDGAFNQIPPEAVLGTEYFLERGTGNNTAEQTTVVATKDNTVLTVEGYSTTGALVSTNTVTLAQAGKFYTFVNGVPGTSFTASHIVADKRVAVYSGTAQNCEVDISTIAPVSECGGSNFIETAKFRNYGSGTLDYFGYILLRSATETVTVNGNNIANVTGVSPRYQIGSTGWYLINFNSKQIGSPDVLSIASNAKLTVSIVQQEGGFSMAGFFSSFAIQPEDPTFTYISGGGCTNNTASLKTPSGFSPYQWYLNGVAISGANSDTYTATKTGAYSVASTLTCGAQTQSKPVSVTLCTDLGVTKTVDNATPCVGSNVEFTVTLSNLGVNNASGVSVNDLLPTGYAFVSATSTVGIYNSGTGVWSIGGINGGVAETLKIVAKVNASGVYTNTATIPASVPDTNPGNNSASVSTTPNPLPTVVVTNPASVCAPAKVDITAAAITTGSTANLTFSYWTNAAATTAYATPTAATAGTYYIKGTTAAGCSDIKPVVVTTATAPNAGTLSGTQNICISGTTTFTSNGNSGGTWASSDTAIATVNSSNGLVTGIAPGTATISYKVTGTGGCADAISTRTVTVNPTPTASITGALTACYTTTLTAVTNAPSPAYVWYKDNVIISGQTASTLVVTADGNYKVKVTNTATTCENTSADSTVKVSDTQKPTITCPANVTAVTDANSCTATGVVLGTPTTTDNCTGTITVTNNAPTSFPIGVTTVTWTAKDISGNTETCTQTVTVNDTQKPTITCPANVTAVADANSCVATGVVLGTPTTTDNCTGTITVTNNAPTSFPIGVTTVTWTAKDVAGNKQTCAQTVTVNDTQKPTITCPANVTAIADANSCVATGVVLVTPTTTDNCTGTITVTNNAPTSFPIGITTVTWTAKDAAGNTQTCTQTVTVNDTQKPTITCPANVTAVADANSCVATGVVLGTPTTTDNCTGTITVTNNAPTSFPIGVTTVTWTAKDVAGNTQTCTQTVTVNDTQKPTITCPANVTAVADANSCVATGVVLGTPTTSDNCTGTITVTNNAPTSFPIGVTTVTWTAKDAAGNTQTCTQTVKVVGPIKANDDIVSSFNGYVGGIAVSNVLSNDLLNCNNVIANDVNLTLASNLPSVLNFNTTTGSVTVNTQTPAGIYSFDYTICEKLNSANCNTASVKITVVAPTIDAVTETTTSINGNIGGTTASLITNDTLNGNPAVIGTNPGQVKLTGITVPTGLTLNTDGTISVGPNTAAGNYNVEYSICEITNPTNCDTAISVIVVGKPTIDAVTETTISINGNTGGTTASLITNDTLNGNPAVIGTNPGQVKLTGITVPTGLTLNSDGTVSVAANTPAGNYNVEYSICEITNPTNCDTVISVIVVGKPTIDAVTETTASINGNIGGTTASLITNDTLNGNPAVIGTNPGQVKLTGITVPTGLTLNADGTVSVAANTPAGNYNVEYSICEITNPTNCDTAISVIVVGKPAIDAVTETTTSINGNIGGTTASLITNDTLNGNPAVIGTNPGQVKLTGITVPAGLTLNADGTVTVSANTPAGNYNVEYSICEITNPTNCDTAISVVVVGKPTIDAVTETTASINGNTGGTTASLINNDTLNGNPAVIGTNPGNVKLTGITVPTGLTLNADGTVSVAANTPAGNYNVEYSICEITNPTNCDTVISVVVVGKATIDAVTETAASINGNIGGTTASLITNDTLNGNPAVIGTNPGQVKLTGITVPTGLTLNADGTVSVAANTPAGNYNVEYSICEITNPTNCDTTTSTIVVTGGVLVANPDVVASVIGTNQPTTLVNVFDNDTNNGLPVVADDMNLSVVTADPKGVLTLNPDGTATLGANAPAGTYELTYQICEKLNPTNCSSATIKVTVKAPGIDAVTETTTSINGNTGGTTASLVTNDTLNGNPAVIGTNPGQVKLTGITVPTGLTLNADGTVSVAANTPAGNYNVEYSICEITNPTNCDTTTSTIVVTGGVLVANPDVVASIIAGNQPTTLVNVFDNDTNNGLPVVANDMNLSVVTADPKGVLTLNPDGTATLGANAPAGTYELTYQICEKLNPTNCSSATIKVTVNAPGIDAVTETTPSINGITGGTTASLITNDTLNGNPAVIGTNPGNVKLTGITVPTGLTLNADGTVTISANTPAGNYNVEYSICEITNPTNCDTTTSTIVVTGGVLMANPDVVASVIAGNQPTTLVNVFDNDTNNGLPVVSNDMNLSVVTADPTGYLTLNPDGTATLGANAPAGNYELIYQICEKLNPTNCSSASIKVTVGTSVINAVEETTTTIINGVVGGTTESLVANDTLNGNPVVIGTNPGQVKLSPVTLPTGFVLNADGTVTVPANTPIGNYNVEYKICEISNPTNCDSAASIIVVTGDGLKANPDVISSVIAANQPQKVVNVFDNDTNNGVAVVPNDLNLTIVTTDPKGVLTLNPDGTVTLGANAPAGNYEIVYQICEKLNPTNCSSASIKVEVKAGTINAATETTKTVINGVVGGTTETLVANDTLNGLPVVIGTNPGDVKLSPVTLPTGFVLNADGTVTVPANTPAGNYNVEYQICEITSPTNCDSAISIIVVTNGDLHANPDVIPSVLESKQPQVFVSVFDNDTNNGIAVVPSELNLTIVTPDSTGFLTLNTDGTVRLGANAPAGTYELTYQICEKLNATNCSQAIVRIKVNSVIGVTPTKPIVANNDGEIAVDGINGQLEFINVLDNDLLDGLPVNASDVILSNTPNPHFEFNSDGTVNVLPNTPGGSYTLTYQICEKANASNCTTATLTVFVEVPAIAIIKTANFNDENKNGFANAGETITYKFKITNTGNVPLVKIMVTDLLPGIILSGDAIDLAVNESDENSFTAVYKITQTDINNGSVTNQATVQGKSARGVIVEDKSDDTNNAENKPTVLPLNGCQIEVLNALSPNGDQKNERFYIRGLECYPDNTVEIYNRWGVLVFDIDHYNNEDRAFVGFSAGRTTIKQSEGLPVGTYFYILKYKDSESNQHQKSGYLYINK